MNPRTPTEHALITSPSAWAWHSRGYESGFVSGYAAGYAAARAVYDEAAEALRDIHPSRVFDAMRARARRIDMTSPGPAEDLEARHRACAASWGIPVDGAA